MFWPALAVCAFAAYVAIAAACTPAQMAAAIPAVTTIAEIAKEVCEEGDDPLACLDKCEAEIAKDECPCGWDEHTEDCAKVCE